MQLTCEGCGNPFERPRRRRFCSYVCAGRVNARKAAPGYNGKHGRVRRTRGPASDQTCVDCGQPAAEWSQRHGTDGTEPEHYDPRCNKCHVAYDIESKPRGEEHHEAKLTDAKVRGIWASVGASLTELAKIHGTSKSNAAKIRRGDLWKRITGGKKADW